MKRRDFLQCRSSGEQQIVNLSCQRLYMGYNDARSQPGNGAEMSSNDEDWWSGEPPLAVESKKVGQLFAELMEEIAAADVLVIEDREWLQDKDFSKQVMQILKEFHALGGEVRYSTKDRTEI